MQVNHKFWTLFNGVQANEAAVAAEMRETGSSVDVAVDRLINAGRLALNPAAQASWQEHVYLHGEKHTAAFLQWAEGYVAGEEKYELAALQREFPQSRDKNIDVLRAEKARHELIDEICDLLRAKDPSGRGGKYGAFNIQAVRKQMLEGRDWGIEKLQARKEEIIREQTLTKRPPAELKQMVKEHYH
jgi:hypothetical protein